MPVLWEDIADRKKTALEASIPQEWRLDRARWLDHNDLLAVPRECGRLSTAELRITESYDAIALVQNLAAGKLKSVEVVTAFAKRAALAHQLVRTNPPCLRLLC
jgi:amidase